MILAVGETLNTITTTKPIEQTKDLFCTCDSGVARPVSIQANEFDVQSVLHGQMSLVAVNQIYVFHEAMNGCKNLKIYKLDTFQRSLNSCL